MTDASNAILLLTTALAAVLVAAPLVEAKIKCDGPNQVIKGHGLIGTPYCEDGYLATVAREYGMRLSADEIRNSPSAKGEACRLIGNDIRVRDICSGYRPEDRPSSN